MRDVKDRPAGMRVTRFRREHDGPLNRPYWAANITIEGLTFRVDCRHGSWMAETPGGRRHVLPYIAVVLQAEALRRARQERREGVAA